MNLIELKKEMRKKYFARRAALNDKVRAVADAKICASLGSLPEVQSTKNVAAYISDGLEVDLMAFLLECEKADKKVFLPRHSSSLGYEMVEIKDLSEDLVCGKYGLTEANEQLPAASEGQIREMLWLVPGVAFDSKGARLGRGMGIYDKLLMNSEGLSIGIFYECQRAKEVPAGEHDQKLDMIITEKF